MILIKTPEQIIGIRKSCQLAAKTLKHLEPFIVPGISTLELNNIADKYIRENGAIPAPLNYKGFPKETCISINEVICHGIPSAKEILKEGQIVKIDITTILDGYFGDTCKTFPVGHISKKTQNLIDTTKQCLILGIEQVQPGNYYGNIGHAIHSYAKSFRYSVVHQFCGHGVGLQFHEEPEVVHVAPKDSGQIMIPGHIFTIEPMINVGKSGVVILENHWSARTIDNKLSAQFEHTVLVTDSGYEILTLA